MINVKTRLGSAVVVNGAVSDLLCHHCVHLSSIEKERCKAFPKGIPEEILLGRVEHTEEYEGDSGIVFEFLKRPELEEE